MTGGGKKEGKAINQRREQFITLPAMKHSRIDLRGSRRGAMDHAERLPAKQYG